MNTSLRDIGIGIVLVIAIGLVVLFFHENQGANMPATANTATSTVSTASTSAATGASTTKTSTSGYTITPISSTGTTAPAAPNYRTPLTFSSNVSADDKALDQSSFAAAQTTLASDPTDYNSWLELGILRQQTGDYAGAAADWQYVTELYPSDPTAFADLGDLYAHDLNEPSRGIAEYKDAIKIDPTREVSFYQNLANIYLQEGDTADAKAVLQQGISAQVSGYQSLQTQLSSMQ